MREEGDAVVAPAPCPPSRRPYAGGRAIADGARSHRSLREMASQVSPPGPSMLAEAPTKKSAKDRTVKDVVRYVKRILGCSLHAEKFRKGGSEAGVDTSNNSSDGDLDEPSGHESGSPDSAHDSRGLSQPASEEQEVRTQAPSPENDERAFSGFDEISFPPLPPPTYLPPNPEEVPIVSCGRYVLPDTGHLSTDQCTSIETQTAGAAPTDRRERSRLRSPFRGEDKSPGVPSSLPANLENKPRRSKAPACSSDRDAPPIAKSQKLDALPTGKGHLPSSASEKR
ncbi:hypothetical protein MRX96_047751 [Rhipicephalus microplus]